MRKINRLALLVLACGWPRAGHASPAGSDPLNFLFLDAGARAVGLGGAYTALAGDANALLYNPAGLGRVQRHEATFMHNQFVEGAAQEYVGFASRQGWGLNLNLLNSGDVPRTTVSSPDGTGLASVRMTDLAVGGGYGRAVSESLSLGVGLKYVREALPGVAVAAYAADAGVLYAAPFAEKMTIGLAVQNLGPSLKYQAITESLPMNLRAGVAYGFSLLGQDSTASLDVSKERDEGTVLGFGWETVLAKMVAVRAGFNTRNQAGPGVAAGLGWSGEDFALDYAFAPFGDLGVAHRLSATVRWGEKGGREEPAPRRLAEEQIKVFSLLEAR